MEIKILIADDHSMVREGIKQLLELDPEFKVIGQARDGKECLDLLEECTPDIHRSFPKSISYAFNVSHTRSCLRSY